MKKGILYQIISSRKIIIFITGMILLAGLFSYSTAIKQESPDFEVPVAIINISYIGASASEIDEVVMAPMEEILKEVDGCEHYTSYSKNNGGSLFMEFAYDVDREAAFDEVRRKLDDYMTTMPEGVKLINITAGDLTTTGFMYSLTAVDEVNMQDLESAAISIKDEISRLDMVKSVHIQGSQTSEIVIEIDNEILKTIPISRYDLGELIGSLDSTIPGGDLSDDNYTAVQSLSALSSQSDIEDLVIGANPMTNMPITLNKIADISKVYNDTVYTAYDGKQGVVIYGYFEENVDMTDFAESFEKDVEQIVDDYENVYKLDEIIYYPNDVKRSNNEFFLNLLIGIGLVIAVSFISMGFRNAVVVSFALPTSVLMTMVIMKVGGIKLHQISIAALIIAIGMLVDNAIVITESIKRKIEEGNNPLESTILGTKEVAIPVLTSTVTTIAAFSPLLFIPSVVGDYIKSVPQVIIIALSSSYIVSITLMPCLSYIMFKKLDIKDRKNVLMKRVKTSVEWLLNKKAIVLILVVLLSGFAITLIPKIECHFFQQLIKI